MYVTSLLVFIINPLCLVQLILGNRLPGPAADPVRDVREFINQFQQDHQSYPPFMDCSYGNVSNLVHVYMYMRLRL